MSMANANGPSTAMTRHDQAAGVIARDEGLSGREMVRVAEVQAAAVAAMVKAEVNARFELALLRPRNWLDVRTSLLSACERPLFADAAVFSVKRGSKQDERGNWVDNMVEGASIRFIEEALRCMRNVMPEVRVLVEDDVKRIVRVTMTDLENNITMSEEFVIAKVIERKTARQTDEVVGERVNSYGKRVFKVVASDDEMITKQAALVSKAIRNLGKRLLPSDIHDECMEKCNAVVDAKDKADPAAARKRMVDAFAKVGVSAAQLETYLGGPVLTAPPARIKPLKGILAAITEGMTWEEATEMPDADGVVPTKPTQAERLKGTVATTQPQATTAPAGGPAVAAQPAAEAPAGPAQATDAAPATQAATPARGRPRGVPASAPQPAAATAPTTTPHVATQDAEPPADWKPTEREPGSEG
jgi:hypothetical protein